MADRRPPGINQGALSDALRQARTEEAAEHYGSMRVMVISDDGPVAIQAQSFSEVQRASRYNNDLANMLTGFLPMDAFDRRWSGRTIGGVPLANADRALYLAHIGEARFDDFYSERSAR